MKHLSFNFAILQRNSSTSLKRWLHNNYSQIVDSSSIEEETFLKGLECTCMKKDISKTYRGTPIIKSCFGRCFYFEYVTAIPLTSIFDKEQKVFYYFFFPSQVNYFDKNSNSTLQSISNTSLPLTQLWFLEL